MNLHAAPMGEHDALPLRGDISRDKGAPRISLLGMQLPGKLLDGAEEEYNAPRLRKKFGEARIVLMIRDCDERLQQVSIRCKHLAKQLKVGLSDVKTAIGSAQPFELWMLEQRLRGALIETAARERALGMLTELGLTEHEYADICTYYESNRAKLLSLSKSIHIRKSPENGLPRSLVYNPFEPHKGMHVLCKTKGAAPELGLGAYNRATFALHVDSGTKKVFRSCRVPEDPELKEALTAEVRTNRQLQKLDPDNVYFATGVPVYYSGPWRPRAEPRRLNDSVTVLDSVAKRTLGSLEDGYHEKLGLIMDYYPDGDLFDRFGSEPDKSLVHWSKILPMGIHLAKGIALAHKHGIINLDNKPENIFLKDGVPRVGDFGMIIHAGEKIVRAQGSPGYVSPEMIRLASDDVDYLIAEPGNEIWMLGCILSVLFKGTGFLRDTGQWQKQPNYRALYYPKYLDLLLQRHFPNSQDKNHIDSVIVGCLQYRSKDRLSARDVAAGLLRILRHC